MNTNLRTVYFRPSEVGTVITNTSISCIYSKQEQETISHRSSILSSQTFILCLDLRVIMSTTVRTSTRAQQIPLEKRKRKVLSEETISAPNPWHIINSRIKFHDADHQFWWDRTGRMLAKLLQHAKYTAAEQYRELFFYALYVAPELGPSPNADGDAQRWESPTTPDHTPIDFSWEWGLDGTGVVRYSFEPICSNAGTELNPLNCDATESWIQRIKAEGLVPGHDLEWYRHFKSQLLLHDQDRTARTTQDLIEETTVKAGTVVAIDMEKSGPVMKIYLYPGLKALELGISNLELCARAVRSLPQYDSLSAEMEPLLKYLQEGTERWQFETGILSIDFLAPEKARIKIYIRAPHTTVDYLMDAITMGGRIDMSGYSEQALADLKDFWSIFLEDAPDVLPEEAPGRARPGFYYTIKAGKPVSCKLYISPVWFCKSDMEVMSKLKRYFETRKQKPDMLGQMANYERALHDIL